jgi:hypothetical protein
MPEMPVFLGIKALNDLGASLIKRDSIMVGSRNDEFLGQICDQRSRFLTPHPSFSARSIARGGFRKLRTHPAPTTQATQNTTKREQLIRSN